MNGDFLLPQSPRATGQQSQNLRLGRIQPNFSRRRPEIGALDMGNSVEAFTYSGRK